MPKTKQQDQRHDLKRWEYCGAQNYSVSGFIIFELFTVNYFQDWAGWGIFTVIPGNPRRMKGDSQRLEARPELQDWPRSELFTVKNSRTGPFSNYLGNNFELCSKKSDSLLKAILRQEYYQSFARGELDGVTDRGVTALKALRGFQRFLEGFRDF